MAPRLPYLLPLPHGGSLCLGERTLVMGILNITPDSFGEPGSRLDAGSAFDRALRMEADGADILDVGGESTRPGAEAVSVEDEMARVVPLVGALAPRLRIPMSVDTRKAPVARAAVEAGAAIVNDVSGLQYDPALARVVAECGTPLVLMHTRGTPQTMAGAAVYEDLMAEVVGELEEAMMRAASAGVRRDQVIVDPGIGFAKRPAHSYGLLARLGELAGAIGRPVLAGPSRKSFMREALGNVPATERDWGTAAAVTAAVLSGAHIVRVHAVREMAQAVRVADEIRRHA